MTENKESTPLVMNILADIIKLNKDDQLALRGAWMAMSPSVFPPVKPEWNMSTAATEADDAVIDYEDSDHEFEQLLHSTTGMGRAAKLGVLIQAKQGANEYLREQIDAEIALMKQTPFAAVEASAISLAYEKPFLAVAFVVSVLYSVWRLGAAAYHYLT